jgi:hypothetical protein
MRETIRAKVVGMIENNASDAIDQRNESTWKHFSDDADYTKHKNALNACLLGYYENTWDTMSELHREEGFDPWEMLESREELFEIYRRAAIKEARMAGVSLRGTWIMSLGMKKHRPLATRSVPNFEKYLV